MFTYIASLIYIFLSKSEFVISSNYETALHELFEDF